MAKVGMKDLALRLNLSTATISKALRDAYDIGEDTKQRVLALAEELNYSPNPHASYLRRKQSKIIAIVVPDITDSFFARMINGAEEVALFEGFDVMIYLSHDKPEHERSILSQLTNGRVDGLLISVSSCEENLECFKRLKDSGVSIIFFDRVLPGIGEGTVSTNDFDSSYHLTQHLIDMGSKDIVFLCPSTVLSINVQRRAGYEKAHVDATRSLHPDNIILCTGDENLDKQLIQSVLSRPNIPDAIIASGEDLIMPVYQTCQAFGVKIPDDIKVAAFSNAKHAAILSPAITTITHPAFEMGQAAAELLIKSLKGKHLDADERRIVLPSTLEIRSSSKK